jgi:hypothetical protein
MVVSGWARCCYFGVGDLSYNVQLRIVHYGMNGIFSLIRRILPSFITPKIIRFYYVLRFLIIKPEE